MTLKEPAQAMKTLAVDLDGTLLRSDMLIESFWSAFSRDWRTPFAAVSALSRGKAALKKTLAARAAKLTEKLKQQGYPQSYLITE